MIAKYVNKGIKMYLSRLIIKEMQMETTVRCHFTSVRLAQTKCCDNPVAVWLWGRQLQILSVRAVTLEVLW